MCSEPCERKESNAAHRLFLHVKPSVFPQLVVALEVPRSAFCRMYIH